MAERWRPVPCRFLSHRHQALQHGPQRRRSFHPYPPQQLGTCDRRETPPDSGHRLRYPFQRQEDGEISLRQKRPCRYSADDQIPGESVPVPLQYRDEIYRIPPEQFMGWRFQTGGCPCAEKHDAGCSDSRHPRKHQGCKEFSRIRPHQKLQSNRVLSLWLSGKMGRQGPHPCPGTNRTHQQSSLGKLVLHLVSGNGWPVARHVSPSIWQQYHAAAHFQARLQQEHLLPPSHPYRIIVGLQRQYDSLRKASGIAGNVTISAHQSRWVQSDFATGAAGISEESAAVANGENQAAIRKSCTGIPSSSLLHRHEQHDRYSFRPIRQPPFPGSRTDGTYRCEWQTELWATLCAGDASFGAWRKILFRRQGNRHHYAT